MSLFSTIAHHDTPRLRSVSPRGLGLAVVALVLGAALGFVVSDNRTNPIEGSMTATPMTAVAQSHGDFLRLNTTDLGWMRPIVPAISTVASVARVDPFVYANVGSFADLIGIYEARYAVDSFFKEINKQSSR